jgi:hypothetical protein
MSGPIFGVAVLAFVLIPFAGAAGAFFILARMRATRPWRIVGSCLAALAVQALIFVAVAPPQAGAFARSLLRAWFRSPDGGVGAVPRDLRNRVATQAMR